MRHVVGHSLVLCLSFCLVQARALGPRNSAKAGGSYPNYTIPEPGPIPYPPKDPWVDIWAPELNACDGDAWTSNIQCYDSSVPLYRSDDAGQLLLNLLDHATSPNSSIPLSPDQVFWQYSWSSASYLLTGGFGSSSCPGLMAEDIDKIIMHCGESGGFVTWSTNPAASWNISIMSSVFGLGLGAQL